MSRSASSKAWLRRHTTDHYVHRAVSEGYRSRAAFKLLEIDAKDRLLKPGLVVVDLGAAPGGWSKVAVEKVQAFAQRGRPGRVLALDVLGLEPISGLEIIEGDFRDSATLAKLDNALNGGKVDLVLSDLSPGISGIPMTDQARSIELAELALEFAAKHLRPGGKLLVKVFQGSGVEAFRQSMGVLFEAVAVRKPRASRDSSAELYFLGKGRKA